MIILLVAYVSDGLEMLQLLLNVYDLLLNELAEKKVCISVLIYNEFCLYIVPGYPDRIRQWPSKVCYGVVIGEVKYAIVKLIATS